MECSRTVSPTRVLPWASWPHFLEPPCTVSHSENPGIILDYSPSPVPISTPNILTLPPQILQIRHRLTPSSPGLGQHHSPLNHQSAPRWSSRPRPPSLGGSYCCSQLPQPPAPSLLAWVGELPWPMDVSRSVKRERRAGSWSPLWGRDASVSCQGCLLQPGPAVRGSQARAAASGMRARTRCPHGEREQLGGRTLPWQSLLTCSLKSVPLSHHKLSLKKINQVTPSDFSQSLTL